MQVRPFGQVHWLGAGLSSVPGIRRLAMSEFPVTVWNRTLAKAQTALTDISADDAVARELDWARLASAIKPEDVVVSMLPASMHLRAAELCLENNAHFVTSSYISEEMAALDEPARAIGLCFVNECGLDPGLDHLLAHALLDSYRHSDIFDTENIIAFRSYCGGFPLHADDFAYKFSWSPLGVLKALVSPARWIAKGEERSTGTPYREIETYLVSGERFEAFPNRDSLPFVRQYGIDADWEIEDFVRGTLRLNGWAKAWQDIFDTVENATGEAGKQRLAELSEELWRQHQYAEGEADRVVLSVELGVKDKTGKQVWRRQYLLDSTGDERGSAMARLVSVPVSLVVEAILNGEVEAGVTPVPSDRGHVNRWIELLRRSGENIVVKELLTEPAV
ncbi:MAG: saccharopine dehydrogenase NADP-binding domain-containing protein [Gammaproteobacteria bacterium]|nr:saccharopine dehydrogenase NADP-binding domain-containing protein [Gammaproteobacteria bacterium]